MPPKRKAAEVAPTEGARIIKSHRVNGRSTVATAAHDRPRRGSHSVSAASELNAKKPAPKPTQTKKSASGTTDGAPKRRGRPPGPTPAKITKAKSAATTGGAPKKRGRPSKGTTSATSSKVQKKVPNKGMRSSLRLQTLSTASTLTSKVKFAKRTTTIPATSPSSDKPRGRPSTKSILKDRAGTPSATKDKKSGSKVKSTADEEAKEENETVENGANNETGQSFWLMKAEPESRMEKGVDVKYSIDDLQAAEEPQGWDGKDPYRSILQL
jgi:hypothetical protein